MINVKYLALSVAVPALLLACGADPGTKPHDMSTAQHEAMAKNEDAAAAAHADQHDPNAAEKTTTCSGKGGCWTSVSNPTTGHAEDARRHRDLAQKHRGASAALVEAEKTACGGLSDDDRDMSPFSRREDIQSVSDYTEEVKSGKGSTTKVVGSSVVFRAVPGLTAEWLQRVVDCHLARAAAVGHDMPEMPYCLLVPNGAKAKVVSAGNGFAVNVFADDAATILEIKKRAEALKAAPAAQ